jgi:putative glutathione S-transferase
MDSLLWKQQQQNKKMKHETSASAFLVEDKSTGSLKATATTTTTTTTTYSKRTNSRTALDEMGKDGSFKRTDSAWRNWVSPGGKHPPAAGRYHVFVAAACPWAHRVAIVRKLKGLEDIIGMTTVMPVWQPTKPHEDRHCGWIFAQPGGPEYTNSKGSGGPFPSSYENTEPEPFYGCTTVRELYEKANDKDGTYYIIII